MLRLVLIAFAIVAAGCKRPSENSVSAQDSIDETQRTVSDASAAITKCRQKVGEGDYLAANDYLLAAMRVAPSSPDVFATAMEFVQSAAKSKEDLAIDLANEIYVRSDGLIPFQPIDRIEQARTQYTQAAAAFPQPEQVVEPRPNDGLDLELAILENDKLPPDVASHVLDRAHARLEAMALDIAQESLESKEVAWDRWTEAKKKLEEAEVRWLGALHEAKRPSLADWRGRIAATVAESKDTSHSDLGPIGRRVVSLSEEGLQLRASLMPFVSAGITAAAQDQADIDASINRLERMREWIYNQHAVGTILSIDNEWTNRTSLEKLRRLAQYDERRLAPYVLRRFEDRWSKWFDELENDDQRIEATKARVLRGVEL